MSALTAPPSPPLSSESPREPTQTVQDKCSALHEKVEELTRLLAEERAATSTLENELHAREEAVQHVQQRSAVATQQALDRQRELENELENEVAMHEMAVLGRNVAAQKNATLAAELERVERQWKEELAKKEVASTEATLASAEVQRLKDDRTKLVQRTKSDARRVRELWQQIAREHEVQVEALRLELKKAQQLSIGEEQTVRERQMITTEPEEGEQMVWKEKDQSVENEQRHFAWELQRVRNACKLHAQREAVAVKERDAAMFVARTAQEALDERNEELRTLKTKFASLRHKHEASGAQYKRSIRECEAQLLLRMEKGKHCAEEWARLWKEGMVGYEQVIYAVNTRLTEVQELSDDVQSNAWSVPREASTSIASPRIQRHGYA